MMEIEKQKTVRGFELINFQDRSGVACSLQKSSLATEDAIWFGPDDPNPQIMACHAYKYGLATPESTGWIEYPIPDEVLLSTRMHLTREQVAELLPSLTRFVETGEL